MAEVELLTSEQMAAQGNTNPVVMRRTMAGLRAAGIVRSEKGHGGGWSLVRPLDAVSLYDIYEALGEPSILAIGNRTESPGCVVEATVNRALAAAFEDVEARLVQQLRRITLASLAADVTQHGGMARRRRKAKHA
jgi:DNA-binding IscR family transcriptional regulator